jgi:hypothetical protein
MDPGKTSKRRPRVERRAIVGPVRCEVNGWTRRIQPDSEDFSQACKSIQLNQVLALGRGRNFGVLQHPRVFME